MGYLASTGRVSRGRTDAVIIPEPLQVDRICIGHRGAYWFQVTTHGRIAHGSMPFLGDSAIEQMRSLMEVIRRDWIPAFAQRRTEVPVVPERARHPTLNLNGIHGGQPPGPVQSPCVADHCVAVFDRRFLLEEGFEAVRGEVVELLDGMAGVHPGFDYDLEDLLVVHPTRTPDDASVVKALGRNIAQVLGREATLVASPGSYDHRHVAGIGGVENCVAYGPGILELAHQPDEWCSVDDLVKATGVLALSIADLAGVQPG